MAEYIDREKIFPNGVFYVNAENPEASLNALINHICNLPTADVVPKSEVEKLKNDLVIWKQDRFNLYQRLELYEMARQKVAREIFEEIEKIATAEGAYDYVSIQEIAELKKKYTGEKECPKCKHFVGCEKANWIRGCEEYEEDSK